MDNKKLDNYLNNLASLQVNIWILPSHTTKQNHLFSLVNSHQIRFSQIKYFRLVNSAIFFIISGPKFLRIEIPSGTINSRGIFKLCPRSLIQSGRERRIDLLRSSRIHPDHPHLTWYPGITWCLGRPGRPLRPLSPWLIRTDNCYDLNEKSALPFV